MTRIQQVHWQLEMDYLGHPYYVSGNAIYHALGRELDRTTHESLHASHGVFVPGQFGRYPEAHSQTGGRPYLGTSLPPVEQYADLFCFRHPAQAWLLDSRPRDALNTHDVRRQSGHPALAHETIMGRPQTAQFGKRTTRWYVSAYLHADRADVLPLKADVLDGLQFGGKRNYGYGLTRLADTRIVELDTLDYGRLTDGDDYRLELGTPFVLTSTYPGTGETPVPWWWATDDVTLRRRAEQFVQHRETYYLETIDHGQVIDYAGDRPIETAKNGITRVGTHSKLGFGEVRLRPRRRSVAQPPAEDANPRP